MSFLYNFSIAIYTLLIRLAAPVNAKARAWVIGRRAWKEEVSKAFSEGEKLAWFHAASLGEF
ncbi:MAG: 3-deoxy-D-manno-octulosonic acid transferase, partial [Bacteroidota bacterium]